MATVSFDVMGEIVNYILPGMAAAAALVWLYIIVRAWVPAARSRGGYWYLEAIFLLGGPVALLLSFLEAGNTPNAAIMGQAVTAAVVALSIVALLQARKTPRTGIGWLVGTLCFYYGTLFLSALFGVIPSLPVSYTVTPLIILAVLCHGGYTFDWLLKTGLITLRIAVIACFAAIWVSPETAFNLEESRTLFGIERLAGIAGHPNGLAALAAVGLFLEVRSGSKLFWKLPFIGALLLAQSSTGYVIAAVGLLIIVWTSRQTFRSVMILGGVAFLVVAIFIPIQILEFLGSALGGDTLTFNGRERIWSAAMHGFALSPVFGYGPELLGDGYRAMYIPGFDAATHAHNQFVQTLASTGIVGMAGLAALLVVLVVFAFRANKATSGLSVALVAFLLLRCISETPLKPGGVGFGNLTVALIFSLIAVAWAEREKAPDEPPAGEEAPTQRPVIHTPQYWGQPLATISQEPDVDVLTTVTKFHRAGSE